MRSLCTVFRSLARQVCVLLTLSAAIPAGAATDLIIIPTARTIGDKHYNVALQQEAELFNTGDATWTLKPKIGIGPRAEAALNIDLSGESDSLLLWSAKYIIPLDSEPMTNLGIGFRSLGSDTKWSPYMVLTHRLGDAFTSLGVRQSTSATVVFAGLDGRINKRLEWMADYDSGGSSIASAGAEYEFVRGWTIRVGVRFPRDGGNEKLNLQLKYSGSFR